MPVNKFFRDSSGRLTFEMFRVPGASYGAIGEAVAREFNVNPSTPLVEGWDVVFQDFQRKEQVVGLAWDNWSGFIVTANNRISEPLVHEIGMWLLQSEWAALSPSAIDG